LRSGRKARVPRTWPGWYVALSVSSRLTTLTDYVLFSIDKPAIKLLAYFRAMVQGDSDQSAGGTGSAIDEANGSPLGEAGGMVRFDTVKAQQMSPTMARMEGVGEKEARSWVRYWSAQGFL